MTEETKTELPSDAPLPADATQEAKPKEADASGLISEHDDAELAEAIRETIKAEAGETEEAKGDKDKKQDDKPQPKATKPDNVPDKFWDAEKGEVRTEELLKSYSELEKKKGAGKDEATAEGEDKKPKQVDLSKWTQEWSEKGDISTESRDAIAGELGVTREVVDSYLAGVEAQSNALVADVLSGIGGKEEYAKLTDWALKNLTPEELEEFNADAAKSGNVKLAKLTIKSLYDRYKADSEEVDGALVKGGKAPSATGGGSSSVYKSHEEINRDVTDPRYDSDAKYRALVDAKIERSEAALAYQ